MEIIPNIIKKLLTTGERENILFVYIFTRELLKLTERLYELEQTEIGEETMINLTNFLDNLQKKYDL